HQPIPHLTKELLQPNLDYINCKLTSYDEVHPSIICALGLAETRWLKYHITEGIVEMDDSSQFDLGSKPDFISLVNMPFFFSAAGRMTFWLDRGVGFTTYNT